jgi:hypothetical protein
MSGNCPEYICISGNCPEIVHFFDTNPIFRIGLHPEFVQNLSSIKILDKFWTNKSGHILDRFKTNSGHEKFWTNSGQINLDKFRT